ncbi:MAG TPA: recombinase family protein, partial [Vicinamibacterales bacterium]
DEERRKYQWGPSTINGNWRRGTGILNNTLYVGRAAYNRQRFEKDPTHLPAPGKKPRRRATMKDASEVEHHEFPDLRIITDDLWERVKARQAKWRRAVTETGRPERANRPKFLFSGLTKCGQCGAGFNVYSRTDLACYAATKMGSTACTSARTISVRELEGRVLVALRTRFLADKVAFEEFCNGFREAQNEHRMQQRARITITKREFDRVSRDITRVIEAIKNGFAGPELKAEWDTLQERKTVLLSEMAQLDEPEPLLHPSMGDLYREKVEGLSSVLGGEDATARDRARDALRGFIERIVIPADAAQPLMVYGDLGQMLKAASAGGDAQALAAAIGGGCGGGI